MVMIQFVNISAKVYLREKEAERKLLVLINMCISHELKNPLNSLIALSYLNASLVKKLKQALNDDRSVNIDQLRKTARDILKEIDDCTINQSNDLDLINFILHNFQDYSSIKSGKFQKKLKKFNICEAVQKVMDLQQSKAQ